MFLKDRTLLLLLFRDTSLGLQIGFTETQRTKVEVPFLISTPFFFAAEVARAAASWNLNINTSYFFSKVYDCLLQKRGKMTL